MKKNHNIFFYFLGMFVTVLFQYLKPEPVTLNTVVWVGVISFIILFVDYVGVIILSTIMILYMGSWFNGEFRWFEPILFMWFLISIYNSLFIVKKEDKFNEGDIVYHQGLTGTIVHCYKKSNRYDVEFGEHVMNRHFTLSFRGEDLQLKKRNDTEEIKPIFVDLNDIMRFPPVFVNYGYEYYTNLESWSKHDDLHNRIYE